MSEIGDKSDPRRRGRWIRFSRDSTPVAQEFVRASKLVPLFLLVQAKSPTLEKGKGGGSRMRSSDFSSPVSGRTEIKESNFSKVRLLSRVCIFAFSPFLCIIR